MLVLVDMRMHNPESNAIYLVDCKWGRMTQMSRAYRRYAVWHGRLYARSHLKAIFPRNFRYSTPRSKREIQRHTRHVFSDNLVLFFKRNTMLRIVLRDRESEKSGDINGDDAPAASLHVVRTLAHPIFHPDCHVHTAYMQMDCYCSRQRYREVLQQHCQQPACLPSVTL